VSLSTLSLLWWLAVSVADAYTIGRAISRGHGVEGTLAWVFAIIAFPGAGAAAYLMLASPSIKRTTRRKRFTKAIARTGIVSNSGVPEAPAGDHDVRPPQGSILRMARALTGLPPTYGNRVELLTENDLAFQRVEEALEAAQSHIWAEYFIIQRDETGRRFLDLLAARARAGVQVRLLFDAVGSWRIDTTRLAAIVAAGGQVEAFLPFNPLRRRWAIHLRNHRKMIVIDGKLGFTGGMNVGDEYSGRARRKGLLHYRDSHLAISGPAVGDLAQTFCEDWTFASGQALDCTPDPEPEPGSDCTVAIIPSGPDQQHNAHTLVTFTGITSAQERVYLTSPYFIPEESVMQALIGAAVRGVDVRVLVPQVCDVAMVGPAGRAFFPALAAAGVRIFEYRPSMLHAKTLVVDGDWGIVGSANWDIRSFRLNFELGALVVQPNFARLMEDRFLEALEHSSELTARAIDGWSFTRRLRYGAARLLAPLL
jgi:cardiolipin synthase